MGDMGIASHAVYVPRLRLERQEIAGFNGWFNAGLKSKKGTRAVCSWDEDSITMAVEAARGCVSPEDRETVTDVSVASSTHPFVEPASSMYLTAALRLPENVSSIDHVGSQRVGVSALRQAFEKPHASSLVVASDRRQAKPASPAEMTYGAGAAAVHVTPGGDAARFIAASSLSSPFLDHFRAAGESHDYYWEDRWIRDSGVRQFLPQVIADVLEKSQAKPGDVKKFVCPTAAAHVARAAGVPGDACVDEFFGRLGDAGVAHPLMMLSHALDTSEPGDLILVCGFGGGAEAILLEAGNGAGRAARGDGLERLADGSTETIGYSQYLAYYGEIEVDGGMRAEGNIKVAQTELYRSSDQILSFSGGKCPSCGAIQFPRLPNCVSCGASGEMPHYELADEKAEVKTFTADYLQYHPAPPLYVGLVQFDNGARVLMEMVDVDPENFHVGSPLAMAFRIKSKDARLNNVSYFWKARSIA